MSTNAPTFMRAPVISARLPLAEAEQGQALLESKDSVGKVLLLPREA
ncbi:hypothetical protein [Tsukamurella sp. NPDC003166]